MQVAREHRIFGGFSMGSVTTWYTFLNALDYFKYYMPISGNSWVISKTGMGADEETAEDTADTAADLSRKVTAGTEEYREFLMDNVLHSENDGDIHYHIYVPESYDGSEPYVLFVTLPGYGGLYFQGVGVNLKAEEFAFEAQKYNENMIIAAPQLSDWGETSADQIIALTRYLLDAYNIDTDQVYANGYSGGGETMGGLFEQTKG